MSINSQASPSDMVIHSQGAPVANSTKPLVEGEIIILPYQQSLVLISGDIYFQGDVELLMFSSFMLFVALMNQCGSGIGTCIHACAQLEPMKGNLAVQGDHCLSALRFLMPIIY
jgi:hypothetical protein